ncbi:MAG: SGNH/GDSL hydrolase family protein [Gemmatimonadales bacterium]
MTSSLHDADRNGAKKPRRGPAWLNVVLPIASLTLSLLVLEVALRWRYPIRQSALPTIFDPRVGLILRPGSEMQTANYSDYSLRQRANSLGFLDRESPGAKQPGTFRILALGDSFVEAQQVPIADKFHVLLEGMLAKRYPGRRLETAALGRSGAGTSAELAYYETYGRAFRPDLVVVVFVHNDFADNSPLLESIYYGYRPEHPPWPLFEGDGNGRFRQLTPDSAFSRKLIDIQPVPEIAFGLRKRLSRSVLVQWAITVADRRWGWAEARQTKLEARRLAQLRTDPRYASRLASWRYPNDLNRNDMFFANEMPPVFDEAEAITDHAFALLAEAGRRDGFKLLVLAIPPCSVTPWWKRDQREIVDKGQLLRIQRIAARHDIPLLDLAPAFAKRGDPKDAEWRYDSHWNQTGHRWTAEAIAEFIAAHEEFLIGAPQ